MICKKEGHVRKATQPCLFASLPLAYFLFCLRLSVIARQSALGTSLDPPPDILCPHKPSRQGREGKRNEKKVKKEKKVEFYPGLVANPWMVH